MQNMTVNYGCGNITVDIVLTNPDVIETGDLIGFIHCDGVEIGELTAQGDGTAFGIVPDFGVRVQPGNDIADLEVRVTL